MPGLLRSVKIDSLYSLALNMLSRQSSARRRLIPTLPYPRLKRVAANGLFPLDHPGYLKRIQVGPRWGARRAPRRHLVDCPKDRLTMNTSWRGVACYALDPSTLKVSLGQSTSNFVGAMNHPLTDAFRGTRKPYMLKLLCWNTLEAECQRFVAVEEKASIQSGSMAQSCSRSRNS
jgi:hypothetical protein